jgi:hypothetical protein
MYYDMYLNVIWYTIVHTYIYELEWYFEISYVLCMYLEIRILDIRYVWNGMKRNGMEWSVMLCNLHHFRGLHTPNPPYLLNIIPPLHNIIEAPKT